MSKTCRLVLAGAAALALLLATATATVGGAAVAKGKITANQIAKNAIRTKHLKSGAVTGDKLAAGAVTTDKLAAGAVTGTQIDESTLGRVPDAAAVGGRTVTSIALDLPNTLSSAVTVASGPGWTVALDCDPTNPVLRFQKTGSASLVTLETILHSQPPGLLEEAGASNVNITLSPFDFRLVSVTAGTATTEVQVTGMFDAGHFGSQKDCYYRGTVTSTP